MISATLVPKMAASRGLHVLDSSSAQEVRAGDEWRASPEPGAHSLNKLSSVLKTAPLRGRCKLGLARVRLERPWRIGGEGSDATAMPLAPRVQCRRRVDPGLSGPSVA